MAPKRPSHQEDPPAAPSSEGEEETSSEDDEDQEDASSSEEGEEQQEQAQAQPTKASSLPSTPLSDTKAPSKKLDPYANSQPASSSSGSGSDAESDSDSEATANPSVKPLASKPMEDSTPRVTTKPRSKPSPTTSSRSAGTKRPLWENDTKESSKRAKKKAPEPNTNGVASPEDSKKSAGEEKKLFQRLWSEDDEIAILKGVLDYKVKKGADPSTDAAAFHEFVKKSLHVDVSKNQLMDKIRRLRKKYHNNAGRGKKGKEPTFSKSHERKAYDISKKIWGPTEGNSEDNVEVAKTSEKRTSKNSSDKNISRSLEEELLIASPIVNKEAGKADIDGNPGDLSRSFNGMVRFDRNMSVAGLGEGVIKRGLELIEDDKRAELEERWKGIEMAELELFVKRTELIKDQAKLIWEAYQTAEKDH